MHICFRIWLKIAHFSGGLCYLEPRSAGSLREPWQVRGMEVALSRHYNHLPNIHREHIWHVILHVGKSFALGLIMINNIKNKLNNIKSLQACRIGQCWWWSGLKNTPKAWMVSAQRCEQ